MTLNVQQWHTRYQQQARWTKNLRNYLYKKVNIEAAKMILEVGCGTGVLLDELERCTTCIINGLDIDSSVIRLAHEFSPRASLMIGDGHNLPYENNTFDITICHFLLLWVNDPLRVLKEMGRVCHSDGYVLALAEPDYGGRIDYPDRLSRIGEWQIQSLKAQGANPFIGRELRSLFSRAGFVNNQVGILGGQWAENEPVEDFEVEWEVLTSDLEFHPEFKKANKNLKSIDRIARESHERILFVPTFYAIGMVKP
jgi:ubiquinone/menaquinone biosynthesis C-methylase UbiE